MKRPVLWPRRLYAQLTLALLGLFLVVALAFVGLMHWSSGRYSAEVTQRLNSSLAMYIASREPLLTAEGVNREAMAELAHLVMTINPGVEVYLLDREGRILDHALPEGSVVRQRVDPAPIRALLSGEANPPVMADDPHSPQGRQIFSAAPIKVGDRTQGYLYVGLASEEYQTVADSLRGSHILRLTLAGVAGIAVFALASGALIFGVMTRPLTRLSERMARFQREDLGIEAETTRSDGSEVAVIARTFDAMRARIDEQLERLKETDRVRRELISSISHDLRTPLASMKGYLETLLLKEDTLSPEQRRQYQEIAHRHCDRLTRLVDELFELTKLDAGRVTVHWEPFSLAELLQDVTQGFMLEAERRGIELRAVTADGRYPVCADIALIDRVLRNLIDNALRHTPAGGHVEVTLSHGEREVEIAVADTGKGVPDTELPHIFDRYFRGSAASDKAEEPGAGLGLAIVKRILDLHGSRIEVTSTPGSGTRFSFPLPSDRAA